MRPFRPATVLLLLLIALGIGWYVGRSGDGQGGARQVRGNSEEQVGVTQALPARETEPRPVRLTANEQDTIAVYESRNTAVVNINTETVAYNWFLEPVPREGSTGSGSIIDDRGYVLTNYHVVENANRVFVTLADGERLEGEVIGRDPENDLAVIKFDPGGRRLDTIPMGDSDELRVGQNVLAIGNPFGLDRTLTTGIVSGLGRPLRAGNDLVIRDMIQTDASINPGNSGGPLLNSRGDMIGINTMIFSPTGGSVGIGFAVPVNTARRVVPDLLEYGVVRRGWLDIVPRQLFPQLVQYAGLPVESGLLVSETVDGGNAEAAGLRGGSRSEAVRYGRTVIYLGGDIITAIDGMPVASLANMYEALEDNRPGETVRVEFIRGRRRMETDVVLSERPDRFQWD
ncbi:MAG: trypsin-like peptidase domain-containing protein [Spirochaeta sp.]|jgi:S1-C subfamily serine protease|nr:trypsin-like peptidase domain-containing protein [Spirochaeta sp.]